MQSFAAELQEFLVPFKPFSWPYIMAVLLRISPAVAVPSTVARVAVLTSAPLMLPLVTFAHTVMVGTPSAALKVAA